MTMNFSAIKKTNVKAFYMLFIFFIFCNYAHCDVLNDISYTDAAFNVSINSDGTSTENFEITGKINNVSGLERINKTKVKFSPVKQSLSISEIYVIKADGRRLASEQWSSKTQETEIDSALVSVSFKELEVGDIFHYKVILNEIYPLRISKFSYVRFFSNDVKWEKISIKISAPVDYPLYFSSALLNKTEPSTKDNRVYWQWTSKNYSSSSYPIGEGPDEDAIPHLYVSGFKDYKELVESYKKEISKNISEGRDIQNLSEKIVHFSASNKEKAKILFLWMQKNIKYIKTISDVENLTPRSVKDIVQMGSGDCKDHAILLESLLRAQGIKSNQVLVNSGMNYSLPKVASFVPFNHVINYIPSLDIYLDSTSKFSPFGILPDEDSDKPVIFIDDIGSEHKTPAGSNSDKMSSITNMVFTDEGHSLSNIEIFSNGRASIFMRELSNEIYKSNSTEYIKDSLARKGYRGVLGNASVKEDENGNISLVVKYRSTQELSHLSANSLSSASLFNSPFSLSRIAQSIASHAGKRTYFCSAKTVEENFEVTIPMNMKFSFEPKDYSISIGSETYTSTFKIKLNHLSIRRIYTNIHKGNVCLAYEYQNQKKIADFMLNDLKQNVIFY